MKTKFFRNTAPVIPTGAKRSGGISRLTHNATIKAAAHVSRFLGKLGMTVLLLSPVVLPAQNGNGVTVTNLVVAPAGGTVTFDVSWDKDASNMPEVWSDTVWVFVDQNIAGVMQRLPLTGATLTNPSASAATATVPLPNNKGAWVAGNARSAGSFSAKVKLYYDLQTAVAGACAYASNYPPVGEYITASSITFTGTPPFDLVLSPGSQISVQKGYELLGNQTLVSFTDKTGAPGIIKCIPPATFTLLASASGFCEGDATGVSFALSGTEYGRKYQLYRGSAPEGAELIGSGSAETFTGTFDEAGTYSARTIADDLYCAIAMNRSHVVIKNPLPNNPDVTGNSRNCAGSVTLSATSSNAEIDWYSDDVATSALHTGESYTTPEILTSTTYYVQARVENTGCLSSARVPISATVHMEGCCDAPGVTGITFSNFSPCSPDFGATWTLTDDRDGKTYKVKYMPDDRYWMVQDLMFGDNCNKTSFNGSKSDKTGNVNSSGTYYGDCRLNPNIQGGYFYDWAAVINLPGAYYGGSASIGCSGTTTAVNACQGICPRGWHIYTTDEYKRYKSITRPDYDYYAMLELVHSGGVNANNQIEYADFSTFLASSTAVDNVYACFLTIWQDVECSRNRLWGLVARCVRNF
jgi:uncharacterized protein (TIGR02145 family)